MRVLGEAVVSAFGVSCVTQAVTQYTVLCNQGWAPSWFQVLHRLWLKGINCWE